MKILLILPDGNIHKIRIGRCQRSMREAPLTLTVLAALVPEELKADIHLVDGSIDRIPLEYDADLVGISAITGTSLNAYELADHYRKRGITTVLGGVHVTQMPDEASEHADSIVIGSAEESWPRLLRDFRAGKLQAEYRNTYNSAVSCLTLPQPRYDLQRASGYMISHTVTATRGCRHACDFCSIPPQGYGYSTRPVEDVIRDVRAVKSKHIAFSDVSLVDDRAYAFELFTALTPLKKRWGGLATTQILKDPDLVALMADSGCRYLLIGFESFRKSALHGIKKGFNRRNDYRELIELLHSHGISVQGCFIFGFDEDDKSVFTETVEQVNELKIDIPRYAVLTPYPGTKLFKRLVNEKRILSYHWADYDTMHIVFQPKNMSPADLYQGFKWAWQETFRMKHIFHRTVGFRFANLINLLGNLNYRRFAYRLERDPLYAKPYTEGHGDLPAVLIEEQEKVSCLM